MNGNSPMPADAQGGDSGDIDLGQPQSTAGMADMPQGGAVGPPVGPQYPSVMLSGDQTLSKIPDEGRSIVHHRVISRKVHTPSHGPHKGKQRHEVEIQLHKIRPMRSYRKAESKSKRSSDETAMRKLLGDTDEEQA